MRAKINHYRDPVLLRMAAMEYCLLQVPGVCNNDRMTTVAAHSNQSKHGKGMGIKAEDCYTVWACHRCHTWLDQGNASQDEKVNAWNWGHERQIREWRRILRDTDRADLYRSAVAKVLKHLGAMP